MSISGLTRDLWQRSYARLRSRNPNLLGDRDLEWSWVAGHIPGDGGKVLDFGPGGSPLGLAAAQRGYDVTALDLTIPPVWYVHPRLHFIEGDILTTPLPEGEFDLVLNCSTVEHVGLAGRYGVAQPQPDGDLEAMARLRKLIRPGGSMLLTIPLGVDAVFAPYCRVYGAMRLPRLLEGYSVQKEAYWVKDDDNRWRLSNRDAAIQFPADVRSSSSRRNVYALGLFVLAPRTGSR